MYLDIFLSSGSFFPIPRNENFITVFGDKPWIGKASRLVPFSLTQKQKTMDGHAHRSLFPFPYFDDLIICDNPCQLSSKGVGGHMNISQYQHIFYSNFKMQNADGQNVDLYIPVGFMRN